MSQSRGNKACNSKGRWGYNRYIIAGRKNKGAGPHHTHKNTGLEQMWIIGWDCRAMGTIGVGHTHYTTSTTHLFNNPQGGTCQVSLLLRWDSMRYLILNIFKISIDESQGFVDRPGMLIHTSSSSSEHCTTLLVGILSGVGMYTSALKATIGKL